MFLNEDFSINIITLVYNLVRQVFMQNMVKMSELEKEAI